MLVFSAGIHQILVRIANREDPDQSDLGLHCLSEQSDLGLHCLSEQSDLGLHCLSRPF